MRDPPEMLTCQLLVACYCLGGIHEGPTACLSNAELSMPPKKPETAIKEDGNKKPGPHSQIAIADMKLAMTPVSLGSMKR